MLNSHPDYVHPDDISAEEKSNSSSCKTVLSMLFHNNHERKSNQLVINTSFKPLDQELNSVNDVEDTVYYQSEEPLVLSGVPKKTPSINDVASTPMDDYIEDDDDEQKKISPVVTVNIPSYPEAQLPTPTYLDASHYTALNEENRSANSSNFKQLAKRFTAGATITGGCSTTLFFCGLTCCNPPLIAVSACLGGCLSVWGQVAHQEEPDSPPSHSMR